MNELEKTPLSTGDVNPCEVSKETVNETEKTNETVCVETESPAEAISEMTDKVEEAEAADCCIETESPAEAISEMTDKVEVEEQVCVEPESPALDLAEVADATEATGNQKRIHDMTKEELLAEMHDILDNDRMNAHREVSALKQAFFNLRAQENNEAFDAFVDAGNDPATYTSPADESEAEFKQLYTEFKEKRAAYLEADENMRRQNLARKQEIVDKLKAISEDIDNINGKFPEFRQLQQDFKDIKEIPAGAENDIWKQFQTVTEQFYDHLKMSKELRDLDFKKNLEAKKELIEEARKLGEVNDPVAAFRSLQSLHEQWREIGPVAKEIRDSLWEEFREVSAVVNRRHQDYFQQRKNEEQANEEGKTKICEELEAIDVTSLHTFNEWNTMTERVIELQKKWKEYGFASKKMNNALYTRFREACDKFFNDKAEYFQKTKDEFNDNLAKKTALCERAEALKDSTDLNKAADEIVKLQAEWKKIGSVPRKVSDAIWQRFQTACNYFFEQRKAAANARRSVENENLDAKRAVIAELKELPLDGDRNEVITKVKELQAKWQEIGFVPFKLKDKIYAEYREVCDALYGAYESKARGQRISKFRERVADMKEDNRKVDQERDKLVRALEARKSELKTIENNMGFFNVKSSAGNSMLKEMERKLSRLKEDIKQIEEKISIIDTAE